MEVSIVLFETNALFLGSVLPFPSIRGWKLRTMLKIRASGRVETYSLDACKAQVQQAYPEKSIHVLCCGGTEEKLVKLQRSQRQRIRTSHPRGPRFTSGAVEKSAFMTTVVINTLNGYL